MSIWFYEKAERDIRQALARLPAGYDLTAAGRAIRATMPTGNAREYAEWDKARKQILDEQFPKKKETPDATLFGR